MLGKLRRLILFLIGDFSWKPPGWIARPCGALAGWCHRHRRQSVAILMLILAAAGGGWWRYEWEKKQPKPVRISVYAEAPGITPLGKELTPSPLWIRFGASVAQVENHAGVPVTSGIRIEPPVEGVWKWATDMSLMFRPKNDWPAGQKYRIVLDRSIFPKHALLERHEVEATTPAFAATMPKIEFYTDPTDPAVKQVTATFEFTHRIDMVELEKHLSLAMIGGSEVFKKDAPRFTLAAGQHQRIAYLRTSGLTLPEREDFLRVTLGKGMKAIQGGAGIAADVEKKVLVPDLYSFFRVKEVKGMIVRNNEGEPEQIVLVTTTGAAKSEDIQKALHVWLLPKKRAAKGADDDEEKEWSGPYTEPGWGTKLLLVLIRLIPTTHSCHTGRSPVTASTQPAGYRGSAHRSNLLKKLVVTT